MRPFKPHYPEWIQIRINLYHLVTLQSEFQELASNLSDYVVKLLDKVQGNEELNVILNNSDGLEHTPNKTLARLQLAIDYKEKKVKLHA